MINAFLAYMNLALYLNGDTLVAATGQPMFERTQMILSLVLCSFVNFGTIAIAIAGIGSGYSVTGISL
ncbi:nucleoside transporter C-terminal domain-containing protein [Shewanella algidipiscicola]|uniref:nucleoside transporter C-terminal domain-containing protein n=1 Tax=Shewanella algidipiscicola TaxID=614070 RepID=UPI001EF59D9D|nr:nucleoside transporter C-terminal domain-containing protein [Shewanella algidipiscicola]